jgi:hypothetical protein
MKSTILVLAAINVAVGIALMFMGISTAEKVSAVASILLSIIIAVDAVCRDAGGAKR